MVPISMPSNPIPPNKSISTSTDDQQPNQNQPVRASTGAAQNIAQAAFLQSLGVNPSYVIVDDGARSHNVRNAVTSETAQDRTTSAPSRWNSVISNRPASSPRITNNQQDTQPNLPTRGRPRSDATADLDLKYLNPK